MAVSVHDETANYLIPVSTQTYREIRAILIGAGQGGLFVRHKGAEAIDMTGLTIFPRPIAGIDPAPHEVPVVLYFATLADAKEFAAATRAVMPTPDIKLPGDP